MDSKLHETCADALAKLATANQAFAARYPGDRPDRQPVHTVYGGAHLFKSTTTQKLGELAIRSLDAYGAEPFAFAKALGMIDAIPENGPALKERFASDPKGVQAESPDAWLALAVHERVRKKLEREAVEDFRIDFEDGFGNRPDDEEDATAERAAKEVAKGMAEGTLPPFIGIRIKPLNEELRLRSIRTLDIFVRTLVAEAGRLPDNFVVTLPKVPVPEQVTTLVRLFEALEADTALEPGALKMELMIELTQTLLAPDGRSNLPLLHQAAEGRCVAAHFGTYDYTASCSITAAYQKMDHPACDFALHMMKVAYANTGLWLSDGATNVMPVAPHRGDDLGPEQEAENLAVVHGAWKMAYDHIRHSLKNGLYQGWDLHPGQLPIRYAAGYAFFLEGFAAAAERLSNFMDKAGQATLVGDVFDDAATGQGLLNYFLRGLSSGAVSLDELAVTGLTEEEIRTRSFAAILKMRSGR
ncbi:MAG: phosphoenolpyruvate kinase [Deltaproteobacteria bacterium]|nr:phosphoenolpyruvate kinase [Deltaproteobacteria bacterium]